MRYFIGLVLAVASTHAALGAMALVYRGPGACDDGCWAAAAATAGRLGLAVRYVGPGETDPRLFDGAAVWIQPGGESHIVAEHLSVALKSRLQTFVAGGGAYVGFCAGGFYGSRLFHTLDDDGQDKVYSGLGFFDGESFLYSTDESPEILLTAWAGMPRYLYWEGGPYFAVPSGAGAEIVATYPDGRPGMIQVHYGQGRAALSGLHPEAPQDWRDAAGLTDPDGLDFALADAMVRWAIEGP